MLTLRRFGMCGLLGLLLVCGTGCATDLLHELKPHRLWRMNRQPPPPSIGNFSVSDPLPIAARNNDGFEVDAGWKPTTQDTLAD